MDHPPATKETTRLTHPQAKRLEVFLAHPRAGELVIGTHLYPMRWVPVPEQDPFDVYGATKVIATANVDDYEVMVTVSGGLFVRPPSHLCDPDSASSRRR